MDGRTLASAPPGRGEHAPRRTSWYWLEVHVIIRAPGEVRNQRRGMPGLDQAQVEAQVGGLEADVVLEAGAATLRRAPLPRRTALRLHHPRVVGEVGQ
jgi:hypothetical protein